MRELEPRLLNLQAGGRTMAKKWAVQMEQKNTRWVIVEADTAEDAKGMADTGSGVSGVRSSFGGCIPTIRGRRM